MKNEHGIELDLPELPSGYRWSVRMGPDSAYSKLMYFRLEKEKLFGWKEVVSRSIRRTLDPDTISSIIENSAHEVYYYYFGEDSNNRKFVGVYR